jgi:hypothetical protein
MCSSYYSAAAYISVAIFVINVFGMRRRLESRNGRRVGGEIVIGRNKGADCYPVGIDHVVSDKRRRKMFRRPRVEDKTDGRVFSSLGGMFCAGYSRKPKSYKFQPRKPNDMK